MLFNKLTATRIATKITTINIQQQKYSKQRREVNCVYFSPFMVYNLELPLEDYFVSRRVISLA